MFVLQARPQIRVRGVVSVVHAHRAEDLDVLRMAAVDDDLQRVGALRQEAAQERFAILVVAVRRQIFRDRRAMQHAAKTTPGASASSPSLLKMIRRFDPFHPRSDSASVPITGFLGRIAPVFPPCHHVINRTLKLDPKSPRHRHKKQASIGRRSGGEGVTPWRPKAAAWQCRVSGAMQACRGTNLGKICCVA